MDNLTVDDALKMKMTEDIARTLMGFKEYPDMETLRQQYKRLILKHHPDKGGSEKVFKLYQRAYEFLRDHIPEPKAEPKFSKKIPKKHTKGDIDIEDPLQGNVGSTVTFGKKYDLWMMSDDGFYVNVSNVRDTTATIHVEMGKPYVIWKRDD